MINIAINNILIFFRNIFNKLKCSMLFMLIATFFIINIGFTIVYSNVIPGDFIHSNILAEEDFKGELDGSKEKIEKALESIITNNISNSRYLGDLYDVKIDGFDMDFDINNHISFSYKITSRLKSDVNLILGATCYSSKYTTYEIVSLYGFNKVPALSLSEVLKIEDRRIYKTKCESGILVNIKTRFMKTLEGDPIRAFGTDSDSGNVNDLRPIYDNMLLGGLEISEFNKFDGTVEGKDVILKKLERDIRTLGFNNIELLDEYWSLKSGKINIFTWNNLVRMFYFSLVTSTTLGFGDITPASGWARILTGIHTLVGLILIGLIVNRIYKKIDTCSSGK